MYFFPQVDGDLQLYEAVLAQLNLPDTYTPVDLKADMLIFMKKNQSYIEVTIGNTAATKLNVLDKIYGIELITLFFVDIAVKKFQGLSEHDV